MGPRAPHCAGVPSRQCGAKYGITGELLRFRLEDHTVDDDRHRRPHLLLRLLGFLLHLPPQICPVTRRRRRRRRCFSAQRLLLWPRPPPTPWSRPIGDRDLSGDHLLRGQGSQDRQRRARVRGVLERIRGPRNAALVTHMQPCLPLRLYRHLVNFSGDMSGLQS